MSDLLIQGSFPSSFDSTTHKVFVEFQQHLKRQDLDLSCKYLLAFKRGGLSFLSAQVYYLLKIWLRTLWNHSTQEYLALESQLNSITGQTNYAMTSLDLMYEEGKAEFDWGSRSLGSLIIATNFATHYILYKDDKWKSKSFALTWEKFQSLIEPQHQMPSEEEIKMKEPKEFKFEFDPEILNKTPLPTTYPHANLLYSTLQNRTEIWSVKLASFLDQFNPRSNDYDMVLQMIQELKQEIIVSQQLLIKSISDCEYDYQIRVSNKVNKYKRLKQAIQNTSCDQDWNHRREKIIINYREILDYFLPMDLEEDLNLDWEEINVESILGHISAHILETPFMMQRVKEYMIMEAPGCISQMTMIYRHQDDAQFYHSIMDKRLKTLAAELNTDRPIPAMGTENEEWERIWLELLLHTRLSSDRPKQTDAVVRDIISDILFALNDIKFNGDVRSEYDKLYTKITEALKQKNHGQKEKQNIFSQETNFTTPEGKRRRK